MDSTLADRAIAKAKGRKDADHQEAVIRTRIVKEAIDDLCDLHAKRQEAADCYNDAVKAVAEKSGLLASAVNRFVVARAGEKFEEAKRKCDQLSLLFEEVGEK